MTCSRIAITALSTATLLACVAATGAAHPASADGPPLAPSEHRPPSAGAPLVFDPHAVRPATYPLPTAKPFELAVGGHKLNGVGQSPTTIRGLVYNPDTSAEPTWAKPVLVVLSPNFQDPLEAAAASVVPAAHQEPDADAAYFAFMAAQARRGYTVVEADMRGSGDSGGCADFWGPDSAQDFRDVVAWASTYDGHHHDVGAFGASAEGIAITNGMRGAGLKTAVVSQALTSAMDTVAMNGVPFDGSATMATYWGLGYLPSGDAHSTEIARPTCPPVPNDHNDYSGTQTPWWTERDYKSDLASTPSSVFYIGGLHDRTIVPVNLDSWYDKLPGFKRAIFGHWEHSPYHESDGFGGYDRDDLYASIETWFDQQLGGLDAGVTSWPDVQVQADDKTWRAVPSVAGMTSSVRQLPLGISLLGVHTLGAAGAPGSTATFGGTSVLTFTANRVTSPVHLSGKAQLSVPVTFDAPTSGRVEADLFSVDAAGTRTEVVHGLRAADHLTSAETVNSVSGNTPYTLSFTTPFFDATVPTGSHLELDLRSYTAATSTDAGMVPSPPYTATIPGDGSAVLTLPIANDTCGVTVVQTTVGDEPTGPTLGCPDPNRVR
ncbi:MAG: hypothetical protein QOJ79_2584 [Actinomycetota bacterium]|jgi:hypothetical protein|nr:hypothetical protein [Actinomycetota bacterium]